VALATLAWGLLAKHQKNGQNLIDKAQRQKENKPLVFPFYTLLMGWQRLFVGAKSIFYDWWRKPKPKDPQMGDLFENSSELSPC